jgi:fimbrial isopeptide formation D2 family protein
MLFFFSTVLYALEAGDIVSNTATVSYSVHGVDKNLSSNTLIHTIEASEAEITFLYSTQSGTQTAVLGTSAFRDENGVWHESDTSTLNDGTVVGNDSLLNLEDAGFYGQEDTAIIRVVDADQNVERNVRDIIEVLVTSDNGDMELLRLKETEPNSGIFIGYIVLSSEKGSSYDNRLFVQANETIVATYGNNSTAIKSDSAVVIEKKEFNVWMEKQVNKAESSIGELLEYTLTLHNDESFAIHDFVVHDALPLGLKYEQGTAKYENQKFDLELSEDGRTLNFNLAKVEANTQVSMTFIVSVTAGVQNGQVVNETWVSKDEIFTSNIAKVTTAIKEELMRSKGIIIGKISSDENRTLGVAGVRLYLENGMYVVTDENGKYHFSGVDAGRHIVQVDKALLPKGYDMGTCKVNARASGNNFSQFVNVGRGALKRVDFCLKKNGKSLEEKVEDNYVIPTKVDSMPKYGVKDLKNNENRAILWPPKAYVPFIPSTKIAIKHAKSERIDVWLNGYRV